MKMVVVDADYTYNKENEPVIRIYGKEVVGEKDLVLHVNGFEPYIYLDNCGFDIDELIVAIDRELKGYLKRIEKVYRFRPIGYQSVKIEMLRLVLFNPRITPEVRRLLVEKIEGVTDDRIYEADILFRDRYLVDMGIDGMTVIEFNETGCVLENYGLGCNNIYIVGIEDIRKCEGEMVKIEY